MPELSRSLWGNSAAVKGRGNDSRAPGRMQGRIAKKTGCDKPGSAAVKRLRVEDQVGGGADEGAHAAEHRCERERHQQYVRRPAIVQRHPGTVCVHGYINGDFLET
eukprot:6178603-Pleurochrysis_carterae.AAC.3